MAKLPAMYIAAMKAHFFCHASSFFKKMSAYCLNVLCLNVGLIVGIRTSINEIRVHASTTSREHSSFGRIDWSPVATIKLNAVAYIKEWAMNSLSVVELLVDSNISSPWDSVLLRYD